MSSDIALHLPLLTWLAATHRRVTEFGVRRGESTRALLAGNPNVVSYDIDDCSTAVDAPGWKFIQADTLTVDIDETDFLFTDTVHNYEHVSAELARHGDKVTSTIAVHDTHVVPGRRKIDRPDLNDGAGTHRAVVEFADLFGWTVVFDTGLCNGLTVLRRL